MLADATTIVSRWTLKVYQAHKPVCISHLSSKAICVHLRYLTKHLFVKESLVCMKPVAYPWVLEVYQAHKPSLICQAKLWLHLSYLTKGNLCNFLSKSLFS